MDGRSLFFREDLIEMDGEMLYRVDGGRIKKNIEEWSEVYILNSDIFNFFFLSGFYNVG